MSLKQIGVRAGPYKHNQAMLCIVIEFVRQQKVAADMTFSMTFPIPTQWVIEPLWPERAVIGDQQEHGVFEPVHVVTTGP